MMRLDFFFIKNKKIHGDSLPEKVKENILAELKNRKNIDLDPSKVRLRERVSDRLTRIYREIPMKSQAIHERRLISIEDMEGTTAVLDLKEQSIFIRFWDCQNWTLSDRIEVIVDKTKSLKDMARKIYEANQTIEVFWIFLKVSLVLSFFFFKKG
jgi:hypothetical protein